MNKILFSTMCMLISVGCVNVTNASSTAVTAKDASGSKNTVMPLKALADQINLAVGAAVETRHLENAALKETLIREFSQITPENEMKFMYLQPKRGQFDFSKADQLVEFAEQHDMVVKGHTLVWHMQTPQWLEDTKWSKKELTEILEQHIKTVVGHYKGRVLYWDVVNEAFDDNGGFRHTLWYDVLGEEYIELAFRFAHEADPNAILFYNDYSTEGMNAKSNAVYRHMKKLVEKGVPVHGVGTQLHLNAEDPISDTAIARNIERLSELGLDTHFTEIDVRIRDGQSPSAIQAQTARYEMLMKLAAYYPEVDMFTTWGVSDQYSWIPSWFAGYGRALMFDENYQPKPVYDAVQQVLLDAVTGNFSYQPVTDLSQAKRYVLPFDAKPLSKKQFSADEVVFYPFAYNQLGDKNQILPPPTVTNGKWAVGYHKNALIGRVVRQDNKTVTDREQSWENDNVEIFVRIGGKFWQFRSVIGQGFEAPNFPGEATGEWSDDGTTFNFVIAFDGYEDLVGETFGFNIALSDNDGDLDSGYRHAQLYPLTGSNLGWQGEELGELFMNGQNAVVSAVPVTMPPTFKMVPLSQKPKSATDPVWAQAYQYSLAFNQLNQTDMTVAPKDNFSGDWRVGYYDNWIYGVVNRVDDVTVTTMEQSYQNDNVELFLQQYENMTQFRTVVGQDFEKVDYAKSYRASWSDDGSQLFFAIELDSKPKPGESVMWNIALSDNDDGKGRKYQIYPVPGTNISYLGEQLTKLTLN
ncbi:endo-1,4-beta-xylanase [Vibrio mytili]|uniref:endo-1,4-beta-xylanase n=1 Tax=Vibrio mytili TaxID=50718 RepID=UPI002F42745B